MDYLQKIIGWEFLNEPLHRWFMFMGAFIGISCAWGGILHFMKG